MPAAACSPAPANPVYTGIQYTDNLPNGLEVTSTGTNACGGSLVVDPSNKSFSLSGVSLNAGASCTTTVNVKLTKTGIFQNRIYAVATSPGGVSNDQQVSATADAVASLSTPMSTVASPIPTLHKWALMLLSVILAGFCAQGLRRSRVS